MKIFRICLTSRQKHYFFIFHFIDFDDFLTTFAKNLMKRPPAFMIDIKSLYKLLLSHKDLRSRNIWQWNDGLLNIFKNLYGNTFSCLFSLNEKVVAMCHLMIHIKCAAIICVNENWSALKWPFSNNRLSNMVSHFFRVFLLLVVFMAFLPKTLWKNSLFNINFWNSF